MKAFDIIAHALYDGGVRRIFGLLGDGNMFHVTRFVGECGGEYTGVVHEGSAVSMADAFARVTGTVGVASVTHGPGATNTLTALTEAVRAHTPLVLVTSTTPDVRDHVQEFDLSLLARAAGAGYHRVLKAEHLADDIAWSLKRVASTRHPLVLDLPKDMQFLELDYVPGRYSPTLPASVLPTEESIGRAIGAIRSARRPIVLGGLGARRAEARDDLVALSRQLEAPLMTSLLGNGMFTGEPNHVGMLGNVSSLMARDVIAEADLLITFGASLNQWTSAFSEHLTDHLRIVQVDIDPTAFGRYRQADVEVVGDARRVAQQLTERLRADAVPGTGFDGPALRQKIASYDPRAEFVDTTGPGVVDVRAALVRINELLPSSKVVVADGGRNTRAVWRYLSVEDPYDFVHTSNFGAIGLAVSSAVGAAIGRPGQLTVCLAGDGGSMMTLTEITTAVRDDAPFILIVINDGCYGADWSTLAANGLDPRLSLMDWPDFAGVGRALGGDGAVVTTMDELDDAVHRALESRRPFVIDVHADAAVDPRELGSDGASGREWQDA